MDGAVTLFSANFDNDEEGFVFRDDAFRDTNQPIYADGQRVPAGGFSGGALQVLLGGVDDADINGMSGGWDRDFNLAEAQQVTLTFRVKLTQSENYEPDEFSEALVSLDGTLLSANGGEAIATINGNGNGGGARTTDWLEIEIDLGILDAGDHTLTFGGFNNKKTLANESTEILFDDIEVVADDPPPNPGEGVLIDADFDTDANGFLFVDDAFRGTDEPTFADGERTATDGFSGGGLEVTLGGIDDSDVNGMSGGWQTSFNLAEEAVVTISFRYNLTQASNYEANEFSQVLLSLDGNLVGTEGNDFVAQINGNGNGGPERTTGWQLVEINLGLLGPGNHDLIIGGFNNRKTLADEETTLLIDDVLVRDLPPPPPGDVVLIQSDFDTDTGGFGFIDDAFRETNEPDFADGQRTPDGGFGGGGALRVELGGIDDSDVLGMSGGWGQSFALTEETNVKLSFRFRLTQDSDYENDEFSQVLVSLNGTLVGLNGEDFIAQITGNGNGGPDQVVGWQVVELDLGLLGPGTHDLILGGFNNKKTFANEVTEILFDDLLLTAEGTAPEPPVIDSIANDTGASNADGITSDTDLLVSGTAEPGATVELFLDGVTSLGTTTADGTTGAWSIQTGPLPEGAATLTATATDAANNTSAPSAGFAIVIDTIFPGIPLITGIADDSGTPGDGITNDSDLLVSGLGEAGTTVELFLDGATSLGTAVVDGSGNWSIQTGPIAEGPHRLTAGATDLAGNTGDLSFDFNIEIDTTAPDAPSIVGIADDTNTPGDGITSDNNLLVSGTAEIGATVELFLDGATSLGTAVADGSGNWSIQTGPLPEGAATLTATATDVAGNPSVPSAGFAIEIDTSAPGVPTIVSIADDTDTPGDGITSDNDLLVSGTAEAGATVELFLDGVTSLGTAVADGLGNWSIQTGVIAVGAHVLTARATDLAGNTSAVSAGFDIEIESVTPVLALSSLDGSNGFVIVGIDLSDKSGRTVSDAGDVNGDGFADLIIGASRADGGPGNPASAAGESYVVFGKVSGFGSLLALSSLDGSNGFILAGIDEGDVSGRTVSGAGDVNGDGFADLIIGAPGGDGGPGNPAADTGETHVVFGRASGFGSVFALSSLDGSNGFVLAGIDGLDALGRSVSGAGDVNGDGFADLIVGAIYADGGPGNPRDYAGESYVVFGRASGFGSVLNLSSLDGSNGFLLAGIDEDDQAGNSVSGAGDVNGDGFADLIVGARYADGGPGNPADFAGESYVVFGKASGFGSAVDLSALDGSNGFLLAGVDADDDSGFSVSGAGDVNGDGFADVIVGARFADGGPGNPTSFAGESYVVFGKASGFGSVVGLSSLDGSNGFVIAGIDEDDRSGISVSNAGDVNGDGLDDLIIGARDADSGPGNPVGSAGESYLVFGRATGFGSLLNLSELTADQGFVIAGIDVADDSGESVSGAGDVNGDGFADLIVGAEDADGGPGNPTPGAGESYVLFGGDFTGSVTQQGDAGANTLTGTGAVDVLLGAQGNDVLDGNGGADVLYGGEGDDEIRISDANFQRIDGGTGTDTLVIDVPGTTLDLTAIADSKLQSIEQIDLNFDNNLLILSPLEVLNLSDSSNRLVVFGESGDTVQASGEWLFQGFEQVDGVQVAKYASGAAQLWIQTGVKAELSATIDLADLGGPDGASGFVIAGIDENDLSGISVSDAGDVNGDGFADVVIGSVYGGGAAGESYVVFGKASGFGSVLQLSSLDGSNGFLLAGIDAADGSGFDVSGAGDVNGDGFADVIVGSTQADGGPDNTPDNAGEAYVLFGKASGFGSVIELSSLDGSNGFILAGIDENDYSGRRVSGAGDVNGDGLADLIVGAYDANSGPDNTPTDAGESYVVFGRTSGFGSVFELSSLDGSNGFIIAGIDEDDRSGFSVSGAGDVNGDGLADLIIGALDADGGPGDPTGEAGESYVVFGRTSGFGSVLDLSTLDGSNGFVIAGIDEDDVSGISVSGAGDLNGDGFADLIIGAQDADGGPGNPSNSAGEAYVVFGKDSGFGSTLSLSALDGSNGFIIAGIDTGDDLGNPVSSAGDVNGDGFDDIIVAAIGGSGGPGNPTDDAGESYLVFGRASGFGSLLNLSALTADQGFIIAGIDEDDRSGESVSGAGDVNGDGFADLIVGAALADGGPGNPTYGAGESYIIFGGDFTGAVSVLGDDGNNSIAGFTGADVLLGAQGNDTLQDVVPGFGPSGPGDVLYGGEGDDTLWITNTGFLRVDGGTGTDTLVLNTPTPTVDLTAIADSKLTGIERIDLNAATNTLILSPLEVLNLSDTSNRLVVFGAPGDEVQASGDWLQSPGFVQIDGLDFVRFTSGAAELLIQDGVTATLNATPVLQLSSLDGANGFVLAGIDEQDYSGVSVSGAGDVNGDGFEDVIVGAFRADGGPGNPAENAGESYVVFGKASGFGSVLNLSSLDGSNGFLLAGIDEDDQAGVSVSGAGDVNGDGFADLIVGADEADGGPDDTPGNAGESYVVFGRGSGFGSVLALSSLDGSNGFLLAGIDENDYSGRSVSGAGDVNGDGFDDLIVGAPDADGGPGDPAGDAGESYVVFGRASGFGSVFELSSLDGSNGFLLAGIDEDDESGISVSGAGDVNGDGFADLIVGAAQAYGGPGNPTAYAGESYVVFGRASGFGSVLNLSSLDGSNGFLLAGIDTFDYAGLSVSGSGDVNGDGFADLIIGTRYTDGGPGNPESNAGESYVVFGKASGFGSVLNLSSLDGSNGFVLAGIDQGDQAGVSVSTAGDVNGDGLDDLIIGGPGADGGPGNPTGAAGESYLVFGRASGFGSLLNLSALSADQGFVIAGIDEGDQAGFSVSGAGDVNGDGFADLIVGAIQADGGPGNPTYSAGESYVIFGGDFTGDVTERGDAAANTLTGTNGTDRLLGAQGNDVLDGNGGADVLYGGEGDDEIRISDDSFLRIDGGTGTDTLVIDAPGTTIDLTAIADSKLQGIEQIDLNFDSNTLILSPLEVLNLSDSSNRLIVFGEPGNEVQASGQWAQDFSLVNIDGTDFVRFTSGAAELLIEDGVTATLNATPVLRLASLDGTNGFVIAGIDEFDYAGRSVSGAGDVNGDGFEDVIIGANEADGGPDNTSNEAGESYVIFGQASGFGSLLELSSLDGSNGFVIPGIDQNDYSGRSVSAAGDVNGDGFADLIIGAFEANGGPDNTPNEAGESYVIFGKASGFGSLFELSSLDGSNGFVLAGIDRFDYSGRSVSGAGDVNGDGFEDVIIGANEADGGPGDPTDYAGESYVVFGRASGFGSVFNLSSLDGSNGFIIAGIDEDDYAGRSVSGAGDVNGDGFADLIVGANRADGGPGDPAGDAGESYVIFGRASGFGSVLALSSLDGSNGFLLTGIDAGDESGDLVSGAGDLNGDGFADLIIGAEDADGATSGAGEAYVVFGRASGFASSLSLSALDGTNGFIIAGIDVQDDLADSASNAGDVNGDGFDDIIVAAENSEGGPGNPTFYAGEAYVIFGSASGFGSLLNLSELSAEQGFIIAGIDAFDTAGESVSGAGDVNGDGFADLIIGADAGAGGPGNPTFEAGESYIVFGRDFTGDVTEQGDETANTLTGTGAADVLLGAQGDDLLDGNGGADVLYGGEGDDEIRISDANFQRIDGGTGTDTLVIDVPGTTLDLTAIADSKLQGIEQIDLNFDNNTLILSPLEVLNLSDSSNRLVVFGEPGNEVQASGDWAQDLNLVQIDGVDFQRFTSGAAELLIQDGVTATLNATPVLQLSSLDGANGFVIAGIGESDDAGQSISIAGDVNGDGFDDLIVGGDEVDRRPNDTPIDIGESYVIFGRASGFGPVFELSSLDGSNGFVLAGIDAGDGSGSSVSGASDVNGDGFADLIIATSSADGGPGNPTANAGESYVVFGAASGFGSLFELSSLDGSNGFLLAGIDQFDGFGISPSAAGDVNGDGFADIVIGVDNGDGGPGNPVDGAGESYVIFGRASGFGSVIALSSLDGSDGFVLTGIDSGDFSGGSVSGAGDVNGDGLADLIIGADGAYGGPGNPTEDAGETYVVFGRTSGFGSLFALSSLDGSNGFVLAGINAEDNSGSSVSGAGDVNGDGFADLIIGADDAAGGPGNPRDDAGEAYVVFGSASGFGSVVELSSLDGTNGFVIAGVDPDDDAGNRVSSAGDVNGDGLDDLIISATEGSGGPANAVDAAGETYLVFGRASGFGSLLELSSLDGSNGFAIAGIDFDDYSGFSVSGAGDVNGDGFADLTIGTREGDGGPGNPTYDAGESYIVFGGDFSGAVTQLGDETANTLTGTGAVDVLLGAQGNDVLDGNGGADVLYGGEGDDEIRISDTNFQRIDGGTGTDTLVIDVPGTTLDLTAISDSKLQGIEQIDLNFDSNTLILSPLEVLNLSDSSNRLLVFGEPGDEVQASGDWIQDIGLVNVDGTDFVRFTSGAAELLIQDGVTATLNTIQPLPELSSLDGVNGLVIVGIDESDYAGFSVSGAGDVNGDGFEDVIVGARRADGGPDNLTLGAGESYVVFGRASGFGSVLELSSLDGSNGFILAGIDEDDYSGASVSGAGDVNGDGLADVIVGAYQANGDAGESYVVFGRASGFGSVLALSSLDGSNGFLLAGIDADDYSGFSVSGAGDVNGDGFDDVIVGAYAADDPPGNVIVGESYVVFGRASGFGSVLALSSLDGSNGFLLDGIDNFDNSGFSVSGAGDVNGDGFADLIVGARYGDGGPGDPTDFAGESYVVFGRTSGFGSVLALSTLDGSNGFVLAGIDEFDYSGFSVSGAGDVNGDGFADLIVGATRADNAIGESYVVFGQGSGFGSVLQLSSLDGSSGFLIAGIGADDESGFSVSGAGDVNGDGFDDLIVGTRYGDGGPGDPASYAGESYLVFGRSSGFGSVLDLSTLDGSNGFLLAGIDQDDYAGRSVSGAGDVNGDGFADLIVGADQADGGPGNPTDATGESYIIFGSDFTSSVTQQGDDTANSLTGTGAADVLLGAQGNDVLDGNGGTDVLYGGEGDDRIVVSDLDFLRLDGGTGNDTLVIDATSTTIDLTQIADSKLTGIEQIDLNFDSNTLILSPLEVLNLSDSSNRLLVFGEPGDEVQASGDWIQDVGLVNVDGTDFVRFTSGAAELLIEDGVTATLNATPVLALSSLDGSNGFVIAGIDGSDRSGRSVSGAGDVNGDGFEDVIVGAPNANSFNQGESYVVFGRAAGFGSVVELSSLDGSNGFLLTGVDLFDESGASVSGAGDVNGDGIADLIIGAPGERDFSPAGTTGESYVVFGQASGFGSVVALSSLDGSNGFVLAGVDEDDYSGFSVSGAGDVNGDGFADLIVGTYFAEGGPDNTPNDAGESYVIFGQASGFGSVVELSSLDGSNGFLLAGIDPNDKSGASVSGAGDVNGDGFADLIVGARLAHGGPDNLPVIAGESYVIFGQASGFGSVLELSSLDGSNGFVIAGIDQSDTSGSSVSGAGDVNGDGLADLIIGTIGADGGPDNAPENAGESYVVFGQASGFGSVVELSSLDGSNGFVIAGIDEDDLAGFSVSGAGDVNGDGLDDLIVGAISADGGPGNPVNLAGEAYVVFGRATGFGSVLDLDALTADQGFVVAGIDQPDRSGQSVSGAGDVNGDGFADLIVGARYADGGPGNPAGAAGESYVIFGGDFTGAVTEIGDDLANTLTGGVGTDVLLGAQGNDVLDGNGGADVLYGGEGDDEIRITDDTFLRVDGGTGTDTLVIDAPNTTIDLTQIADGKLQGIEQIDLNFDSNTLILSPLEVLNLSDTSNRLVVFGEPRDTVQVSGSWVSQGFEIVDGVQTAKYVSGAAELLVQTGVTTDFIDGTPSVVVALSSLDGTNGFVFKGIDADDRSGFSVASAGDVNGDGFEDVIIGAYYADQGAGNTLEGESYLVFGGTANLAALDAADGTADGMIELSHLDGSNGFILKGIDEGDRLGRAVTSAGDVNGDGFADLIIGASLADQGASDTREGESYLVFGGAANLAALDAASGTDGMIELSDLDGVSGFIFQGIDEEDASGFSVTSAGDVNGDGFDDLIIGARYADQGAGDTREGESYLVFGGAANLAALDAADSTADGVILLSNLDGSNGFVFKGIDASDRSGRAVSSAGDVNGDGFDDLLIGADSAAPNGALSGESYLVFGGAANLAALDAADNTADGMIELSNLDGSNGFVFQGIDFFDFSGRTISSAGDVDGDGFDDLLIGAFFADQSGGSFDNEGESYLLFGGAANLAALDAVDGNDGVIELSDLTASTGYVFKGIDSRDYSGFAIASAGDVNGDGFDDLIVGASTADQTGSIIANQGETYLVFGGAANLAALDEADGVIDGMIELANLGSGGLLLPGIDDDDLSGFSASSAGDVNGDGFDDLMIGAPGGPTSPLGTSGESYLIYGGDFTGAVTETGDAGANELTGTGDPDVLLGALGDDTLIGNGGADVLYGGEGDDRIAVSDLTFQRVDGGTGTDTLVIDAPGTTIDLTTIADSKLQGIEQIDLNFDSNTLILSPLEVLNLSDSSNRLVVFGEPGDEVQASGEWLFQGFEEVDGVQVAKYASGAAQLWIQTGVTAELSATIALADLGSTDGANGFAIAGSVSDLSGYSVSAAGDVNGDGFGDVIVGAAFADGGPGDPAGSAGESYVVFGRASGFGSVLSLSSLDGSNGFLLAGIDIADQSGRSVSGAGDVNGDGFADLIVDARFGNGGPGNPAGNAGESYVVFGQASGFGSVLSLSSLDGSNGFLIAGIDASDVAGFSVSDAGDVNGDGFADLIIGAPSAGNAAEGESYLVFGQASGFGSVLSLSSLDGSNGFLMTGIDNNDGAGFSVSGAGDVNGDGFADLIIGARFGGAADEGESYLVFGQASGFGSTLSLSSLDGSNGFRMTGIDADDSAGYSVSGAGDVNGDGLADLIIGGRFADGGPGNPAVDAGESYVVFGQDAGFGSVLSLSSLDGSNGFLIAGIDGLDGAGVSVSSAGDVNGDGLDDLIIGAAAAGGGPGNPANTAGESYLVFGRASGFGSLLDLDALTADQGFVIAGIELGDLSGGSVSGAGDVNGDGFADLIVGARFGDGGPGNPAGIAGESYVIFGGDFTGSVTQQGDETANTLTGTGAVDVLLGAQGNDELIGNGSADVLYGGEGDDILAISDDTIARLKGGTGEDTLRLDGAGFSLDLTALSDLKIEEMEIIDLQEGVGAHSLTLDLQEVLNISDSSNSLTILGDGNDTLDIGTGWTLAAGTPAGFDTYTQGAATLVVDEDITIVP